MANQVSSRALSLGSCPARSPAHRVTITPLFLARCNWARSEEWPAIVAARQAQNAITPGGAFETGTDKIYVRANGAFENIEDVIPREERAEHGRKYKAIAGFGIEEPNAKPRTIPE